MSAAHTADKWRPIISPPSKKDPQGTAMVATGKGSMAIDCSNSGDDWQESADYARLIAAAPLMLKTLSDMDGWLANTGYDTAHPWRISIRAAIAAANGEAS